MCVQETIVLHYLSLSLSLPACLCVCVHVCMVCVCIHVCLYLVSVHLLMRTCVCMLVFLSTCICVCVCVYACMRAQVVLGLLFVSVIHACTNVFRCEDHVFLSHSNFKRMYNSLNTQCMSGTACSACFQSVLTRHSCMLVLMHP